jgi:hypothetical protein
MDSCMRLMGTFVVILVISCALDSLLMEMHMAPKQAAARTGVLEQAPYEKTLSVDRQEAPITDFWYVDHVPC